MPRERIQRDLQRRRITCPPPTRIPLQTRDRERSLLQFRLHRPYQHQRNRAQAGKQVQKPPVAGNIPAQLGHILLHDAVGGGNRLLFRQVPDASVLIQGGAQEYLQHTVQENAGVDRVHTRFNRRAQTKHPGAEKAVRTAGIALQCRVRQPQLIPQCLTHSGTRQRVAEGRAVGKRSVLRKRLRECNRLQVRKQVTHPAEGDGRCLDTAIRRGGMGKKQQILLRLGHGTPDIQQFLCRQTRRAAVKLNAEILQRLLVLLGQQPRIGHRLWEFALTQPQHQHRRHVFQSEGSGRADRHAVMPRRHRPHVGLLKIQLQRRRQLVRRQRSLLSGQQRGYVRQRAGQQVPQPNRLPRLTRLTQQKQCLSGCRQTVLDAQPAQVPEQCPALLCRRIRDSQVGFQCAQRRQNRLPDTVGGGKDLPPARRHLGGVTVRIHAPIPGGQV